MAQTAQAKRAVLALALLSGLAACAGGNGGGPPVQGDNGPDEFAVLPSLPLVIPATLDLPPPSPGGTNLTDRDPVAEGIIALGGRPGAGVTGDPALIAALSGTAPGIRQTLAEQDADARGNAGGNRYWRVYVRQALDAWAELLRLENLGVTVPTAPPQN